MAVQGSCGRVRSPPGWVGGSLEGLTMRQRDGKCTGKTIRPRRREMIKDLIH